MQGARINIGILAHVDAGKTTLAESLLLKTGTIRRAGRVDHKDAFLDTYELEKARGITIFSKMAQISLADKAVTLIDTPGHEDFSMEMERTLQILDYAILVISGSEGIQPHVRTLWDLLELYQIPVIVFVNKMDQPDTDSLQLMQLLKKKLDDGCVYFGGWSLKGGDEIPEQDSFFEELATCDEQLFEKYLADGLISGEETARLILERKLFPCFFGSALRMEGIGHFLEKLGSLIQARTYPETFGARIYKIARDGGARVSFLKVTGGVLKVKQVVDCGENEPQKVDQIRICSGSSFTVVQEAPAGTVCGVTGLKGTKAGEGIGAEQDNRRNVLEPVLAYSMLLPEDADLNDCYGKLKELEEEVPELKFRLQSASRTIRTLVMGEVQIEVLKELIRNRYGLEVTFGAGEIVYKETIADAVEGAGHYEPLRHYAEVHLILEPGERGSGIQIRSAVSTDELDLNWQRLIMTHLTERSFPGVLGGYELTDVKITLVAGKAHLKHTEGGDFRQATYRAVRHALMRSESVLLEPVCRYRLQVPCSAVGRAISDIQNMHGSFEGPVTDGETAVLTGRAPVAGMQDYALQVRSYTGGTGQLSCRTDGYEPCHNAKEVLAERGYDPEADKDNPAGSVFCAHGAGFYVSWKEAASYMHLPWQLQP